MWKIVWKEKKILAILSFLSTQTVHTLYYDS